jgi:hypothetical protein
MTGRHHRAFRLLASTVTAAALAIPATAAAGGNAVAKGSVNDSNPILQNDIRHFGNSADGRNLGNPVVVRVEGGFDWAAAGVGAAGGVGLALVVGAGAFSLRRRRLVDALGSEQALQKGVRNVRDISHAR